MIEPLVTQVKARGVAKVLYPAGLLAPGVGFSVLQYWAHFADQQSDAATRFMVACLQGVRDYHDTFFDRKGRDATMTRLTQRLLVKDPKVWELSAPTAIDQNGRIDVADARAHAELYKRQGRIDAEVPDLSPYVDSRFADAATRQPGLR